MLTVKRFYCNSECQWQQNTKHSTGLYTERQPQSAAADWNTAYLVIDQCPLYLKPDLNHLDLHLFSVSDLLITHCRLKYKVPRRNSVASRSVESDCIEYLQFSRRRVTVVCWYRSRMRSDDNHIHRYANGRSLRTAIRVHRDQRTSGIGIVILYCRLFVHSFCSTTTVLSQLRREEFTWGKQFPR